MKIKDLAQASWLKMSVRITLAVLLASLIYKLPLDYLEAFTFDWRVALSPLSPTSGLVTTVAIDTETLKSLQKEPSIADHQKFLTHLLEANPKRIIYLLDPTKIAGSSREKAQFAEQLRDPRVLFAIDELPPAGMLDMLKLAPPYALLTVAPGPVTMDKSILAKDGVTRRLIVSSDGVPTYPLELAHAINGQDRLKLSGQFELLGASQAYIAYHPTGTYTPTSFLKVQNGSASAETFKNKIVIVGRDTREDIKDYVKTPYSREVVAMSVLELHANMVDTAILDRAPRLPPKIMDFIVTLLFGLITVYLVLSVRPLLGLGLLGFALGSFVVFAYSAFAVAHWWIPMAHPLLATLVCYYFFIPYRLIMENRRSWEYLQKNKLLTQVEELKSNFLRMMSHDLRTPLARIQGMANIVLTDPNPLSDSQRRAVETVYRSSEELSDFIGSVLNLGRIESKEIKLHLKSRDINSLLNEVIRKSEFLARKRGVELRTEFEPMFSFKVDEDLIRQVLTNVVENAIKYSPEQGKILVSTEEVDGQAIIQVADQGIGIPTDDLPHVFEKFYRSRNVKQADAGGSGLGLYLVKYFVELHHGRVEVESEQGKGSTFTIILPMVVDAPTRGQSREGEIHV